MLQHIDGCTYNREDLGQRRMGLIAQEVEDAIQELAIDNVVNTRWHLDDDYRVLDYARLVALLIPAVNSLRKRVKELEAR